MIKNSILRVEKYLGRLSTAKRYNQECIHSFLEGWDGETPLLVADLKALLQFASSASTEQELQKLREELAEETEAAENWRRLALQFDNHRMQAIGHLKAVTNPAACFDKYKAAKAFLNAPPLGGEEVLAQRIATLAAQAKQENSHE